MSYRHIKMCQFSKCPDLFVSYTVQQLVQLFVITYETMAASKRGIFSNNHISDHLKLVENNLEPLGLNMFSIMETGSCNDRQTVKTVKMSSSHHINFRRLKLYIMLFMSLKVLSIVIFVFTLAYRCSKFKDIQLFIIIIFFNYYYYYYENAFT